MEPLVSERAYIDWLPAGEPAVRDEDERVIVIQGRTGFYLDVRCRRGESGAGDTLTWATAGWKTFQPVEEGQDPRARFTAIFDSNRLQPGSASAACHVDTAAPDDPPDEGSFSTLPNGDVLERGEMRRPETGIVTPYEELWRRLPLTCGDGSAPARVLMLESVEPDPNEKTFCGRVGDWEVGIARHGAGVRAQVQRFDGGGWTTLSQTAGAGLPLPHLDFEVAAQPDEEITIGGRRWKVIEQS
ncbi:hypothetical protein JCM10908_004644 [Rhodotorula pacifica]|uniref:uncharacterized protein n=1 Tax=Rhodotorula pacifica TaxID=1495444 RepID=UPI003176C7B1